MFEINISILVSLIIIAENQELNSPKKYTFDYREAYNSACRFKYTVPKRAPIEFLLEDIQKERPEQDYIKELEETLKNMEDCGESEIVRREIEIMKNRVERKNTVNELRTYLTGFPRILKRGTELCFSHHKKGEYLELALFQEGFDPLDKQHSPNGEMGYIFSNELKNLTFGEREKMRQKCRESTRVHTGKIGPCVSFPEFYDWEEFKEVTDDILEEMGEK